MPSHSRIVVALPTKVRLAFSDPEVDSAVEEELGARGGNVFSWGQGGLLGGCGCGRGWFGWGGSGWVGG
jgi:hypothetical protein